MTDANEVKTLREHRLGRLLTLKELAAKAGVHLLTIHKTELGQNVPTLRTVKAISEALGVDPLTIREFRVAMGVQS